MRTRGRAGALTETNVTTTLMRMPFAAGLTKLQVRAYATFMLAKAINPGGVEIAPGTVVGAIWRKHVLDMESYFSFCATINDGKPIVHTLATIWDTEDVVEQRYIAFLAFLVKNDMRDLESIVQSVNRSCYFVGMVRDGSLKSEIVLYKNPLSPRKEIVAFFARLGIVLNPLTVTWDSSSDPRYSLIYGCIPRYDIRASHNVQPTYTVHVQDILGNTTTLEFAPTKKKPVTMAVIADEIARIKNTSSEIATFKCNGVPLPIYGTDASVVPPSGSQIHVFFSPAFF